MEGNSQRIKGLGASRYIINRKKFIMAQDTTFQEEMDIEIDSLPGTGGMQPDASDDQGIPEIPALFDESEGSGGGEEAPGADSVLTETRFPEITKRFEENPHHDFEDPDYYKIALSGEGDIAQRVHTVLQKYIHCKDPKDRGVYRQQLSTAYWDFLGGVARKSTGRLPPPKKYLLRFGLLHPTFLNAESRNFFAKIVAQNELSLPIYYLDEWFRAVGTGAVATSSTDEVRAAKNNSNVRLQQFLDKAAGKREGARGLVKAKDDERHNLERNLIERVRLLTEHSPLAEIPAVRACYSEGQKRLFGEVQELLKQMIRADRDLEVYVRDYTQADADVKTLREKMAEAGAATMDFQAVESEFGTVRQMAKMTIGRQGNHFPVLSGEYFRSGPNDVGFRENVVSLLSRIESIDPEVFCRNYKNRLNRIPPFVVLLPTYGDVGVCWEPFDRHNRATSRGRIAVPMYPKNLTVAILSAVADLRWQVAKEKASYYWMEEGLTGNYYQWFTARKLKGDVKEYFVQDYITWMTKESEGTQKLDKEIRGIFWRYMPFSREIKEKLKGRSFAYQELYQRDVNRSLSDGY
jgi:hypothetical protein